YLDFPVGAPFFMGDVTISQITGRGGDDYYKEKKYPFLGENPFPELKNGDLKVFNEALDKAIGITKPGSECDTALKEFGIASLNELVNKYVVNGNVFDGRASTLGYPPPSKGKRRPISEYVQRNRNIGAIASLGSLITGTT